MEEEFSKILAELAEIRSDLGLRPARRASFTPRRKEPPKRRRMNHHYLIEVNGEMRCHKCHLPELLCTKFYPVLLDGPDYSGVEGGYEPPRGSLHGEWDDFSEEMGDWFGDEPTSYVIFQEGAM